MLETKYDGEDLPHRLMWVVVEEQAELAKTRERDWSIPSLVAMVFAFHAMEAYLNYVGQRLAPEIWEEEREHFRTTGFKGKLSEVMDTAGLNWEPGKRPIQTVLGLEKLRMLSLTVDRRDAQARFFMPKALNLLTRPSRCAQCLPQRVRCQKQCMTSSNSQTRFTSPQNQGLRLQMYCLARKPFVGR